MPYSSNKTINGLDAETTISDTDELIFGDVSDTNRAKKITFANFKTEITSDDTDFVRKSLYDANTILQATTNDTPVAITIAEQTVVGRATGGNITALAIDSDLSTVSTNDDTIPSAKATKTALDLKANDSDVVKLTGNQTVAGVKTFSSDPIIPDEAYSSSWDGVLEPPTKNAVYDKIETLLASAFTLTNNGTTTKNTADSSTTQNIAHGLGKTPRKIKLTFMFGGTSTLPLSSAVFVYNGTTKSTVGFAFINGRYWDMAGTDIILYSVASGSQLEFQTGVISMDATNISIVWTKTNSPTGTYSILWEAEA